MKYFLAPRSGEKSYKNFLSTIKHGIPFDRIESFLTEEGKQILKREEVIYSWGNREGKKSEWKKMDTGDVVLFYATKNLVMAGEVIYKQHDSKLALAMWPPDEHGQPWSYTFFLNNLRYFKIPIDYFNTISGYKFRSVQGFQEITEPYRVKILQRYSSFEQLFNSFTDENSLEIPNSSEPVYANLPNDIKPDLSQRNIGEFRTDPQSTNKGNKRKGYVDFDEINKSKAILGSLGEELVVRFERDKLINQGKSSLAKQVKRISLEDTYAGYDVLSFDESGTEIKIEVKSTNSKQGGNFTFNLSRNEKVVAENDDRYYIYLVYGVKTEKPSIHIIKNPFRVKNSLSIEPSGYIVKGRFI